MSRERCKNPACSNRKKKATRWWRDFGVCSRACAQSVGEDD